MKVLRKIAASVLWNLFIGSNGRCHTTNARLAHEGKFYILNLNNIHSMISNDRDKFNFTTNSQRNSVFLLIVQPAWNLHKPSDPGGPNYARAVEYRGRTPVEPGGHDPRVSR